MAISFPMHGISIYTDKHRVGNLHGSFQTVAAPLSPAPGRRCPFYSGRCARRLDSSAAARLITPVRPSSTPVHTVSHFLEFSRAGILADPAMQRDCSPNAGGVRRRRHGSEISSVARAYHRARRRLPEGVLQAAGRRGYRPVLECFLEALDWITGGRG